MKNENGNWKLSGIGWGLLLILIGVLVFADNQGLAPRRQGWLYFAIGLGALFIIGFLVRCLGNARNIWSSLGGLVAGSAWYMSGPLSSTASAIGGLWHSY